MQASGGDSRDCQDGEKDFRVLTTNGNPNSFARKTVGSPQLPGDLELTHHEKKFNETHQREGGLRGERRRRHISESGSDEQSSVARQAKTTKRRKKEVSIAYDSEDDIAERNKSLHALFS